MVVLATFVLFCIMYVQFSGPVIVRRDLNGEDFISICSELARSVFLNH